MHRAERVVEIGSHDAGDFRAVLHDLIGEHFGAERLLQEPADDRNGVARISDLPAHQGHQAESKEEKQQGGDAVLDADNLVIGGKDILLQKAHLMFVMSFMHVVQTYRVCRGFHFI